MDLMRNDVLLRCVSTTTTSMLCEHLQSFLLRFSQRMMVVVVTQRNETSLCVMSISFHFWFWFVRLVIRDLTGVYIHVFIDGFLFKFFGNNRFQKNTNTSIYSPTPTTNQRCKYSPAGCGGFSKTEYHILYTKLANFAKPGIISVYVFQNISEAFKP